MGKGKRKALEDMLQQNEGVNLKRGSMQKTRGPSSGECKVQSSHQPGKTGAGRQGVWDTMELIDFLINSTV